MNVVRDILHTMSRLWLKGILTLILTGSILSVWASPLSAATLSIGNLPSNVSSGETLEVPIGIDTDNRSITGADIRMTYDANHLSFVSVKDNHFFPFFSYKSDNSTLHMSGVVTDTKSLKSGKGKVATVAFKVRQAGTASIQLDCDTSQSDTSKIIQADLDATNIIDCTAVHTISVNISDAGFFSSLSKYLFGWWK